MVVEVGYGGGKWWRNSWLGRRNENEHVREKKEGKERKIL